MSVVSKFINWIILLVLAVIWGTSFILIKKGLESFSSFQIANLRIFISFIFLLPVAIKNIRKVTKGSIWSFLIIGFIGSAFPAYLYPLAQTHIESSVAGMLNSLTPVFTLIIGIAIYSQKALLRQVLGIFLGFVGAAGLLYKGSFSFDTYGLLIVLATLFYGISSNQVTRLKGINGLAITSLAFLFIGPIAGVNLLLSDFSAAVETEHWLRNLSYIGILSIFGSGLALAIFNILILRTTPVFASSVTYLIPIVASIWGLFDGEDIKSSMIISVICILLGVYLTNRKSFNRKNAASENT
jgi:drug/metabolite transporter (DMT)-like permease